MNPKSGTVFGEHHAQNKWLEWDDIRRKVIPLLRHIGRMEGAMKHAIMAGIGVFLFGQRL
jgi:hypothetical protein